MNPKKRLLFSINNDKINDSKIKHKLNSKPKKSYLILFTFILFLELLIYTNTDAQEVSNETQLKNFLIERGTGIACGSCPTKELENLAIINNYPEGKGFLIQYHFGPDARPQSSPLNVDYRTQFGDSIMYPVWPFYLNMMVNRRDKGNGNSTFIIGSIDEVTPECASVATQSSPVNLAMTSTYNPETREITVNAKAYYTANSATANNYLQIIITEDSVIGPQVGVGGSSQFIYNFAHMNMFRANMNGPMGDLITTTSTGTTVSKAYKYTVPAKYGTGPESGWVTPNPGHFKLNMFMTEAPNESGTQSFTGKIITVIRAALGTTTDVEDNNIEKAMSIFPNHADDTFTIRMDNVENAGLKIYDLMGSEMSEMKLKDILTEINICEFPAGIYVVSVTNNTEIFNRKLIVK